jgi:hypothetical protein
VVRRGFLAIGIALAPLLAASCVDKSSAVLLGPSPVLIPDAVTMAVGESQTFTVLYADVVRFDLAAEGQHWEECVAVDEAITPANTLRLVAKERCGGLIYVRANIGEHRSPMVAVVQVE